MSSFHFNFELGWDYRLKRYDLVCTRSPYGGLLVICNESSLWRYHKGDVLKFLGGVYNEWTKRAIWNHLEAEVFE